MKKILLGTTMFAGLMAAGAAQAADLRAKAPPQAAPVYSSWAGFYIGVHGGYGWGSVDFGNVEFEPTGGLVGGHAGYLWQWGTWVGGLEVDYSAASLKDDLDGITSKIDALGSARARLGWLWTPNLLAYGTAGVGWAHTKLSEGEGTSAESSFGWVAGAGLEYQFANSWRLRAEYLHYDFSEVTYVGAGTADVRVDVVRGALSFKF